MSAPVLPASLTDAQRSLLGELVTALQAMPGCGAVVLGGSHAAGEATAASDMDIGLYYDEETPPALAGIRQVAERFAQTPPVVTGFYEWGAWVNGGAWIETAAGKVDLLYREYGKVGETLRRAQAGQVEVDFLQQPTFGFVSTIYLAELAIARPLFDPQGRIAALQDEVRRYPSRLQTEATTGNLWLAEFSLLHARTFAVAGDLYNTVGCLGRISFFLTQALYALNGRWFLGDKRSQQRMAGFALLPAEYSRRLNHLLAAPGATPAALTTTVTALQELWQECAALTGGAYHPRFLLPAPANTKPSP